MKRWFVCRFVFSVLLVSFLASVMRAQVPTGTINGRVTDPGNAVVTGAQVVVVNQSTNVPRETVTNSDGLYLFSDLGAGQCDITIKASGFATSEFRNGGRW
jgi:Carboxypeptidase regulatory-like domain